MDLESYSLGLRIETEVTQLWQYNQFNCLKASGYTANEAEWEKAECYFHNVILKGLS